MSKWPKRFAFEVAVGAGSARKSRLLDGHFLAFKATRNSDDGNNHVCILCCRYRSRIWRVVYGSPNELGFRFALPQPGITHFQLRGTPFLQVDLTHMSLVAPSLCYQLVAH